MDNFPARIFAIMVFTSWVKGLPLHSPAFAYPLHACITFHASFLELFILFIMLGGSSSICYRGLTCIEAAYPGLKEFP